MAVCGATSGTASIDVADLEAVPEVDETKSIYNEIESNIKYYVSLINLLEILYKRNVISMVYSDGASRF